MTDETIRHFIDQAGRADFDRLAIDLIADQIRRCVIGCEPDWSGLSPGRLESWQAIPPISASALQTPINATADHEIVAAAMRAYWQALTPPAGSPLLLLAPTGTRTSAAAFALAARQATAGHDLTHPLAEGRVDTSAVRSWLAARQRSRHPASIIATAELLGSLLRFLERRRLRFRLPAGSQLITIEQLVEVVEEPSASEPSVFEHLGLAPGDARRLLVVPTLTTPLQTNPGGGSTLHLVAPPHWVRYRLTGKPFGDPDDNEDRLVIMDLATNRLPSCQAIQLRSVTAGEGDLALQD